MNKRDALEILLRAMAVYLIVDGLLKVRPGSPVNAVPIAEGTAKNSEPSSVQ